MHILLETERLRLRRFTQADATHSDAPHLFALDNDPDVMRYINGGIPTPYDVIQNKILPGFLHYDAHFPGYGFWAIIEKCTGDFLGWLSFRPTGDDPHTATLGYRLHKAAWGRGYATEGARALIDKGFREWGVQRVVATTYEHNTASIRVMEKLGLTLVRRFRITSDDLAGADTFHTDSLEVWDGDDVEYALERVAWAQNEKFVNG